MKQALNSRLRSIVPGKTAAYLKKVEQVEDCLDLTRNDPDFGISDVVHGGLTKAIQRGKTHYATADGDASMRIAVADFEKRRRRLSYTPEEILMTAGATEALYVAFQGILNPGDEVIIPAPAVEMYETMINLAGGKAVYLDTLPENCQITAAALAGVVTEKTKAIVLNSPNNPTGTIYSQASLEAVREAVTGKEIFVVCDDVYDQIVYEDSCPSFAAFGELKAQILVAQSFSQAYAMAGFRMGYLMGAQEIIEELAVLHKAIVTSVVNFSQDACIQAIHSDVMGMVWAYDSRRKYVCERLDDLGLSYPRPQGSYFVFLSIEKYGLDSETFANRLLEETKVAVLPGVCFGKEGYVRISYSIPMGNLRAAFSRLEDFLKTLKG